MGGFTTGGLNFDAKVRRESFEPVDLFHAHIGGMDAFARGLKIAHAIIEDGRSRGLREAALQHRSTPGSARENRERERRRFAELAKAHARQRRGVVLAGAAARNSWRI